MAYQPESLRTRESRYFAKLAIARELCPLLNNKTELRESFGSDRRQIRLSHVCPLDRQGRANILAWRFSGKSLLKVFSPLSASNQMDRGTIRRWLANLPCAPRRRYRGRISNWLQEEKLTLNKA